MDVRKFGAEGIGLCRTEHIFFNPMRIKHMREMIWLKPKKCAACRSGGCTQRLSLAHTGKALLFPV